MSCFLSGARSSPILYESTFFCLWNALRASLNRPLNRRRSRRYIHAWCAGWARFATAAAAPVELLSTNFLGFYAAPLSLLFQPSWIFSLQSPFALPSDVLWFLFIADGWRDVGLVYLEGWTRWCRVKEYFIADGCLFMVTWVDVSMKFYYIVICQWKVLHVHLAWLRFFFLLSIVGYWLYKM